MYRFFASLYPKKVRDNYKTLLKYSDIKIDTNSLIGFILFFGLGVSIALAFYFSILFQFSVIALFIILFFTIQILVYMWISLKADAKGDAIEKVLPDALQLMSSNLRAGMTTDQALMLSSRPEFGPFQKEINTISKEITIGNSLEKALTNLTKRVKSEKLEKTVYLLVSGIKSGGELAELLSQISKNLRNQELIEEKIKSNVLMYVIFIFIAIGIGAPLLFGLSSFLIEVLIKNLAAIDIPDATSTGMTMPLTMTQITISSRFVIVFAIITLLSNSILGSFVIGLISKGRERYGLKLAPLLALISIGIFFIVRFVVKNLLSGLFGI